MKPSGLRAFLGSDFDSAPLKPIGLRARNTLKPWLIRQPQRAMSRLVTTRDGRRFKLLTFGRSILDKRRAIETRLRAMDDLAFVPALRWSDERHLLVDWVEGETPRADDPVFARCLGESLAQLYRVDLAKASREGLVADLLEQTRPLFASGRLEARFEERLVARLSAELPEEVPTSVLCGDQNLANFVLTAEGSLSMIDPGSFQSGQPIDIFFAEGDLQDAIDRDAFHSAYESAGGIAFPFAHREPLRLFQLARGSALQARVLDTTPFFERRRARNLARALATRLTQLREALGDS